ncbi:MAG: hypothetical protein JO033_27940 [Acidobacteriaceae bacterium]|nr:hypothetical protein [Acidobacteriaceae bacterium]MBV9500319.1 hypothetical protein [Acidobacteriaceae bacterium]
MARTNTLRSLTDAIATTRASRSSPVALSEIANNYFAPRNSATRTAAGKATDFMLSAMSARAVSSGIRFGSPSSRATTSSGATGFNWSHLLEQAGSGGLANLFGGGGSLLGGFGSLFSGLVGLFGSSKPALPALVRFQLPAVQDQVASVNLSGGSTVSGEHRISGYTPGGIYGTAGKQGNVSSNTPTSQYQKSQIVQTVKQALLNSSSLNDVVAEI